MKREIKFRAWNRIVGRMQFFTLPDIESQKGKIQWQNLDISQFTGLLDKNGKEIYEGDILSDKKGGNGVVEYCQPQFVVWADGQHFALAEGKINMTQLEYSEIIGNIFENPELLTPYTPREGVK